MVAKAKKKVIDVAEIQRQNRKAARAIERKKQEDAERIKREIADGTRKKPGRKPKPRTPEELARIAEGKKRGPGRPPKPRTPEEIAEIERKKAESKARGRGRPRINPLPTPEEIKAKKKAAKEREERRKENERKRIAKEMRQGKIISKTKEAPEKKPPLRAFNVQTASGRGGGGGRATTKVEKKVESIMSSFHQEFADIKKMIGSEAEDFQNDKSSVAMMRAMLAMSVDLMPVAEKAYRDKPNNFNMSALANLSNQIRELQNDIRNLQDLEQQIEHINREIMQPGVRQMANFLINETFKLKKELGFYVKKASVRRLLYAHVDAMATSMGKAMSQQTVDMNEKVRKYLLE